MQRPQGGSKPQLKMKQRPVSQQARRPQGQVQVTLQGRQQGRQQAPLNRPANGGVKKQQQRHAGPKGQVQQRPAMSAPPGNRSGPVKKGKQATNSFGVKLPSSF
jgi:hypothetical protein